MTTKNHRLGDVAVLTGRSGKYKIAFGLGTLAALAGGQSLLKYPDTHRTAGQALKGDWDRLGGDMRRASNKVMAVGKR